MVEGQWAANQSCVCGVAPWLWEMPISVAYYEERRSLALDSLDDAGTNGTQHDSTFILHRVKIDNSMIFHCSCRCRMGCNLKSDVTLWCWVSLLLYGSLRCMNDMNDFACQSQLTLCGAGKDCYPQDMHSDIRSSAARELAGLALRHTPRCAGYCWVIRCQDQDAQMRHEFLRWASVLRRAKCSTHRRAARPAENANQLKGSSLADLSIIASSLRTCELQ